MSFFSKLFNTEKEENNALTKEQKQIEKKLKKLNHMKYDDKKTLSAVRIENPYFGKICSPYKVECYERSLIYQGISWVERMFSWLMTWEKRIERNGNHRIWFLSSYLLGRLG